MTNLRIQKISSLDLPELAPYRTLKRSAAHAQLGIFVVEGDKVLHRLLDSNFTVVSVLLIEERLAEFEPGCARGRRRTSPFLSAPNRCWRNWRASRFTRVCSPSPKFPRRSRWKKSWPSERRRACSSRSTDLNNAENVGLLMRNCVAFGISALIAGETCCSLFLRRTVRNSMGAVFKLPVLESANLVATLRELRVRGVHCLAAHPHTEKMVLSQANFTGDCCVVFGSEGHGISQEVLAACDEAVAIPMANDVDSLNVSAAVAVFLYEANRQRGRS